ncbi:MAG: hypothetical protein RLZZ387_4035 [Chloroflexota bacterium]
MHESNLPGEPLATPPSLERSMPALNQALPVAYSGDLHKLDQLRESVRGITTQLDELEVLLRDRAATRRAGSVLGIWALPRRQATFLLLALAAAATILFVRLYGLGTLQAELYGDIATVYEYVAAVRNGDWPTYYVLGVGPLYAYLVAPVTALLGLSYTSLKIAAVLISLVALAGVYALARRLTGSDHFALLSFFVAGVSSWLLVYSRLGDVQIIIPVLVAWSLYLLVRGAQTSAWGYLAGSAALSALGLYVHPSAYGLPLAAGIALVCLRLGGQRVSWSDIGMFALSGAVCALPFAAIVLRDPVTFTTGYIGEKFVAGDQSPLLVLLGNAARALLALHVEGDDIFRSNPIRQPHLDTISGLLLIAGVVYWLQPERRRWSPVLLVPLIVIQLPSILVLGRPEEVPSAARTLGITPVAYILVASGAWLLLEQARRLRRRWAAPAIVALLLAAILLLNVQRYFQQYLSGLPYQNTPIGALVAAHLSTLPDDTEAFLVGCCWEGGMPEPEGVSYSVSRPGILRHIEKSELSCEQLALQSAPTVLIWSFHDRLPTPQLEPCAAWLTPQLHTSPAGLPVFYAAPLRREAGALQLQPSPPPDAGLVAQSAAIDGQAVAVLHSPLDIGAPSDLFDGDSETLLRGAEANPLVIELRLVEPRQAQAVIMHLTTMPRFRVEIVTTDVNGGSARVSQEYVDLPPDPIVEIPLPEGTPEVRVLRVEIHDLTAGTGDTVHIHVRELRLEP